MKFWTFLILTYPVLGEDAQGVIVFPSMKECGDAMPALYEPIHKVYPDSMAQCRETNLLSASPRPRMRPSTLNDPK